MFVFKLFRAFFIIGFVFISFGSNAQATSEVCNDGIDNDADGLIDCNDSDCTFAANIEKGCNCYDNADNDGDGFIDTADANCAAYYGLTYQGASSNCSITPPSSATPFVGLGAPIVSGQNTADTQSKVAVGDVDGDGIPDAIITSKWNAEIRVVATRAHTVSGTSYAPGDIKSDIKLTGQGAAPFDGTGGCKPKNLLFEHEILFADIDKDKIAEIFAVVSNRAGNPDSPPNCFFLVAYKYAKADLVLMAGYPVQIGPDRPGIPGLADMDGDGKAELYLRDRIFAAETGKLLASEGANAMTNTALWDVSVSSAPAAINIMNDNKLELIVGTKIYGIPTLTNRSPASPTALTLLSDMNTSLAPANQGFVKLMNDPVEYGIDTHSSNSVADFDGDGFIDIFMAGAVGSATGRSAIFYWNVQKNTVFTVLTPSSADLGFGVAHPDYSAYLSGWIWGPGRINLGDPTGDGKLDLTFMAGNQLFCLTGDGAGTGLQTAWTQNQINVAGSIPLGFRTINDSRSGVLTCTIYDFDNDGKPELVYRDSEELVVVDGLTGVNKLWSVVCQSHTYTEGPVIADVNGDGGTDICVTCYRNNSFDINQGIQQQALGEIRLFFSSTNAWLPTRKVWNQPGYFVVNINDNLTLPFPQLDQNLIFGQTPCFPGQTGPVRPLNVYLNQVPNLGANGCPIFPAPDLAFYGDDPAQPGVDTNGDGVVNPTVSITPPICGNLDIKAKFNIKNSGDLPISDNVPVSFFDADPQLNPATANRLFNTTLPINNLGVDQTYTSPEFSFNGPGTIFTLYVVLYDDGATLPIVLTGPSTKECSISNNLYSILITPDPFTVTVETVNDNFKCLASAPDNGQLRSRIFKGGVEVLDYSPYTFQWYTGTTTASPIAGATNYNLTGLDAGTYSVVVTNTAKGCQSGIISGSLIRTVIDPDVSISVISNQTSCTPPNGQLQASVVGGNTGYTFEWYDVGLTPLGITGPTANNLMQGTYVVLVSKGGCTKTSPAQTVTGPPYPDALAQVLQDVVDCSNPNSGSINADASIGGVVQNPANYTFDWYYYNLGTGVRGSILPPANGTGQTRTALAVGSYQALVKDNTTGCISNSLPITVTSTTVFPTPQITQIAPQTSCDTSNPNGILQGEALIGGVLQDPASFTFEWFKGQNTLPANLVSTVSGTNGQVVNKVEGGGIPYTLKVTTSLNCSAFIDFTIAEDVNVPVVTLTPSPNSICDPAKASGGAFNGSVAASVTFDGVAVADFTNYTFDWRQGSLMTDPVLPGATGATVTQLNGGNYTLRVTRTDLTCLSTAVTATVTNTPTTPAITITSTSSTNCAGGTPNGSATTVVTNGGVGETFSFQWFAGDDVNDPVVPIANGGNTAAITSIQGGLIYTVLVTNNITGCPYSEPKLVVDDSAVPIVSWTSTPNGICDPALTIPSTQYSGTVTASATYKGVAVVDFTGYTFEWHNGPLITDAINISSITKDLININGGFYTFTATITSLNCKSTQTTGVVNNVQDLPDIIPNSIASTNCIAGKENGLAEVVSVDTKLVVTTTDYRYQWYTGTDTTLVGAKLSGMTNAQLPNVQGGIDPIGTFTVLVINKTNGCKFSQPIQVSDAKVKPTLGLIVTDNGICDPVVAGVSYSGQLAGVPAYAGAYAGPITYEYEWFDGDYTGGPFILPAHIPNPITTPLTNLQAGFYTSRVTIDEIGCSSDYESVEVKDVADRPELLGSATASTNCIAGLENGTASLTQLESLPVVVNPPNASYIFQWYMGADTTAVGAKLAGKTAFTLTGVQGGPGPLTAAISPLIVNGEYTALVFNTTNGCRNELTLQVADAQVKPTLVLVPTANGICDPVIAGVAFSGEIQGNPGYAGTYAGPTTYTHEWYDGEYTGGVFGLPAHVPNPITSLLTGLDGAQFYTSRVTIDEIGCFSDYESIEVDNAFNTPELLGSATASTNCIAGLENGTATLTQLELLPGVVNPPDPNYIFQWYMGADTTAIGSKLAGKTAFTLTGVQGGPGPLTAAISPLIVNGEYTALVFNTTNGCRNELTLQISDAQVKPTLVLVPTANGICNPVIAGVAFSGEIQGNPGYAGTYAGPTTFTHEWYDGEYSGGVFGLPAHVPNPITSLLTGLDGAQFYTSRVTIDEIGCSSDYESIEVDNAFNTPELLGSATASTNCIAGKENGTASLTQLELLPGVVNPPDPNYIFQWYMGADTTAIGSKLAGETAFTLTGIQGGPSPLTAAISPLILNGEYTVLVFNTTNGCRNELTLQVADAQVRPTVTLATTPNTVCDAIIVGDFDGTVTATPAYTTPVGGTPLAGPPVWELDWSAGQGPDGSLAIINVTAKGSGYTVAPVVIAGDGVGATATAIISSTGEITGIDITNPGTGYTLALTTVTIGGDGAGATATAEIYPSGPLNSASLIIDKLKSSFYSVTVTLTEIGCTSDLESAEVVNDLWNPVIDIVTTLQTSCVLLAPNGVLAATVNEVTLPVSQGGPGAPLQNAAADYTITWYKDWNIDPLDPSGNPLVAPGVIVGQGGNPNGTISDLAGNKFYAVYATRLASGCVSTQKSFLGEDIKIPVVTLGGITDFSQCLPPNGSMTATVDIAPSLPTETYTFYWLREQPNDVTTLSADVITSVPTDTYPNRLVIGGIGSNTDTFSGLIFGDYTIVVVDNYTQCVSQPVTENIVDNSSSAITIIGTVIPATCSANTGEITMTALRLDLVPTVFTFELYKGGPTNADLPITFFGAPPNPPSFDPVLQAEDSGYPQIVSPATSLPSYLFTVVATDGFGCKNYKTYFLPFQDAHQIDVDVVNSSMCPSPFDPANILVGNGSLSVQVSVAPPSAPGANQTQFDYVFYTGGVPDPVAELPDGQILSVPSVNPYVYPASGVDCVAFPADPACTSRVNTTTDLVPGIYTLSVIEKISGQFCPVYETIEIKQAVLPPLLDLVGILKANDACDVVASANGEATVEIQLNAADESATFGAVTFDLTVLDDALVVDQSFAGVAGGIQPAITSLQPSRIVDPYTIRVETKIAGVLNGCVSEKQVAIPDQPTTAELLSGDVFIFDAEYCTVVLEQTASARVSNVRLSNGNPEDITDYEFKWFTDLALTSVVHTANGDLALNTGGDEFSNIVPPIAAGTVTVGSYWVKAEKKFDNSGTGGIGCFSAPFQVDIGDKAVVPTATLTPTGNTSCDAVTFEGQVMLEAATTSLGLPAPYTNPGVGSMYTYVGTGGTGAPPLNGNGDGDGVGVDDNFIGRQDGTYQVRITNDNTGCFVDKITTIEKISPPIFTLTTNSTNQDLCFPSGSIQVTDTFVNGVSEGGTGNFVFRWYDTSPGVTPDPLVDGNPLEDSGPAVIGADLLNNANYATIGFGDFYLKAIRTAPGGQGCASALVKVDLLDVSEDPIVGLTPFSNTACDADFEGSIQIAITEVPATPGVGQQYVYEWTTTTTTTPANVGALVPAPGPHTGTGIGNELITTGAIAGVGLEDGFYTLKAYNNLTGCFSTDTKEIIKNTTPVVILQAVPTPQDLCFPSGSVQVQAVSLDGTPEIPADVTANYDYTWSTDVNQVSTIGGISIDLNVGNYPIIVAGSYYVKAIHKTGIAPGSGCESPVVKVDILDVSEDPIVGLTPFSNTACDANFEGSVQIAITEVPATPGVGQQYVYEWTSTTTTTPANVGALVPAPGPHTGTGIGNELITTGAIVGIGLEDGFYTLKAYNNLTGCFSTDTKEIIRNQTPVVILQAVPTPQDLCFPSGSVLVQAVSLDGIPEIPGDITANYDYTWSTDVGQLAVIGDADIDLDIVDFPTIGVGSYYVKATRKSGVAFAPGSGCESPVVKVDILDVSEDPIVGLTPFSNTACDANFEGSIQIAITEVPATPGVGQQYVYEWTTTTTTTPANVGALVPAPGPHTGTGIGNELITTGAIVGVGLREGFYTLKAYNNLTGCSRTDTKEIIRAETPIVVVTPAVTNQFLCAPTDGRIDVTDVKLGGNSDAVNISTSYTYTWFQNSLSTIIAGQTGISLTGRPFGAYYVKATRNSGLSPGSGCASAPVLVEILDRRQSPIVTYLLQENTACDNNFDGRITVLSSDLPGPGLGSNYDISWPVFEPGSSLVAAANVGGSYTTPLTDEIGPGDYAVQVLNRNTQCFTQVPIVMVSKPQPLEILTVTKQDQDICYPDGSITVSTLNSGAVGNYTFEWFRDDVNSAMLIDNSSAVISGNVLQPGVAAGQYPTMGAGIFYVVATKNSGSVPGSGCATPPFRTDILDNHVDPRIQISSTPNSSCNNLLPNGTITADASESSGVNIDTYSFAWKLNGSALPGVTTINNTSNRSVLGNSFEGSYVLTLTNTSNTGCFTSASLNLILDQTRSTPNIVDVSWVDPIDCNPTVSATVTKITLGSTTNSSLIPPNVAPNNEVTGTGLLNFDYEWYQGSFTGPNQVPIGGPFTTTPTINTLMVGNYFVIVHDPVTDCKSGPKEIVIKDDNIIYPVLDVTQPGKQLSCIPGVGTGSLAATADGQTDANINYGFVWFKNLANAPPSFASTSTIANLLAGNYSVTVLDLTTGCTSSAPYIVPDDKELYRPLLSMGGQPRTFCVGQDGSVLARVTNIDPTYPFPLSSTAFTADLYFGANPAPSGTPDISNIPLLTGFITNFEQTGLAEGFYTVRVTDNNTGCVGIATDEVKDERVNPIITIVEENPLTNCDPVRANGQLFALADGQVTEYNFDWYVGTIVPVPIEIPLVSGNILIGKTSGSYTVRGTNSISGCFTDKTGSITDKTVIPPVPNPEVVFHRTNCILPNGSVTTSVGGVTFNYTFNWFDGATTSTTPDFTGIDYRDLDIGKYSVTATDDITGCISPPGTVEVLDKRVIPEFIFESTPSYCSDVGKPKGVGSLILDLTTIDVVIYEANWFEVNNPSTLVGTGPAVYELFPGIYTVEVTTTEGCTNEGTGEVKTEINPYNGISSNRDGSNDVFIIDCISNFPNNNVKIFNRSGILVYEMDFYNNVDRSFAGIGLEGIYLEGKELPVGTYYYIIDKRDGSKAVAGYLELDR
ncbi:MAG: gliding motility-associated C-terminal domain-containing protein [Bacteroidota bacterium]